MKQKKNSKGWGHKQPASALSSGERAVFAARLGLQGSTSTRRLVSAANRLRPDLDRESLLAAVFQLAARGVLIPRLIPRTSK